VGDRLHDGLRDLGLGTPADPDSGGGFNPLRNEADMFRVLVWFVVVVAVIVVIVLVARAF
jgi:hypothetical protein